MILTSKSYDDIIDEYIKAVEIIKQMPSRVNRQLIVKDIGEGLVRVYFSDNPESYDDIPEVVWENFLHNIKNFPQATFHPHFSAIEELYGIPIIRKGLYE